ELQERQDGKLSAYCKTERIIEPGESVTDIQCFYFSGYYYLKNSEHYALMEPDIMTVRYIEDGYVKTAYYDFLSQKQSRDPDTVMAYYWTDSELGDMLPKPDAKAVLKVYDSEDYFSFDALGISKQEFQSYISECKGMGYTVDADSYENHYSAENGNGYSISIYYDSKDMIMDVSVEKDG
ncbi:MAG: hypothetical protein IKB34_09185, partial [Clostridia bacterium]|nr:hypothetical protein [Clostridia bacterium]